MKLIISALNVHVSSDTVSEFEEVILDDAYVSKANLPNKAFQGILFIIYRLIRKSFHFTSFKTRKKYAQNPITDIKHLFMIMMGLDLYKYRPYGLFTNHNRSIYLFDAWPHDHEKISNFVNQFKIDYLFVTASQAVQQIKPKLYTTKVYWIPEGINPKEYKQNIDLKNKKIDVLAIGRKFDTYHKMIVDDLKERGYNYLYEKAKGQLIFPSRNEFIEGIANCKISICVPSNITHPDRAADIETMTIRYLQSMVSKCIVLGHAPTEMIELFGYNPVIEIDYNDPIGQIELILKDYADYEQLIERNYYEVLKNHTWQCRWEQIKTIYIANSKN